jgi:hypothetical protein
MRVLVGFGCVAIIGLAGCASTARPGWGEARAGVAPFEVPSVRVGQARVVDGRVNPLVPVHLSLKDGAIAVSFAHFGHRASGEIDPASLELRPNESPEPARAVEAPSTSVERVALDNGRFLVCWTSGTLEWGHRAMAQIFNSSDGSPRGAAVAISPPDADVIGQPRAITSDGSRIVAMFAAETGSSFELMAVPLDDSGDSDAPQQSARR